MMEVKVEIGTSRDLKAMRKFIDYLLEQIGGDENGKGK